MAEKGTRNLLLVSSIVALGGLAYFLLSRRNLKVLNIYSIGKNTQAGKLFIYITTKSSKAIEEFIKNSSPLMAIEELDLAKNPNNNALKEGTSVEIKGMEGLDGTYSVISVLAPASNPNRVMAVKLEATSIPASYTNIPNGNKDRFYANSASSVGKLIIK
jgi:hypothetical protein